MKREQTLRRKLESLRVLGEAITAMKSLSAHHLRASRAGLVAARAYRDGIDRVIASAGIVQIGSPASAPAFLLIAADLGLCGGYSSRLTDMALEQHRLLNARQFYCVGRRPLTLLRRQDIEPVRVYPTVTNVGGLSRLLLTLADDVLGDYLKGSFSSLHVVSARYDGVGAFTARTTRILPVASIRPMRRAMATPYADTRHLAQAAVREYLYSTLYELLLDALASEHGMRLIATQSAAEWLDDRVENLQRQLLNARREASTQEVLDVAGTARQRRRRADAARVASSQDLDRRNAVHTDVRSGV